MNTDEKNSWTPFSHSSEAVRRVETAPETPQTQSDTYRLAFADPDFMTKPRPCARSGFNWSC